MRCGLLCLLVTWAASAERLIRPDGLVRQATARSPDVDNAVALRDDEEELASLPRRAAEQ
jgi:hypothetical protein